MRKHTFFGILLVLLLPQAFAFSSEVRLDSLYEDMWLWDSQYFMTFTNQLGQTSEFPVISNDEGIFTYGDRSSGFVFVEGSINSQATSIADHNFTVGRLDYFILSTQTYPGDTHANTHILRYEAIDLGSKTLQFGDLGVVGRSFVFPYTETTSPVGVIGYSDLVFGGRSYRAYISNLTTETYDNPIAVDMNADGFLTGAEIRLVTVSGEVYDFGNANESVGATVIPSPNRLSSGYVGPGATISTPFVTIRGFTKKDLFGFGRPRHNVFSNIIVNATGNFTIGKSIDIPRVFGEGRLIEQNGSYTTHYFQNFILQANTSYPATFIVQSP